MADNTWMNSQITDSVTQTNVKVLGDAPAESMGMLYQMMAQSTGMSMQNMVANQQHKNSIDSAVVTLLPENSLILTGISNIAPLSRSVMDA